MKAAVNKDTRGFTPFTLSITFDSLDEANSLYDIFNCTPIVSSTLICSEDYVKIREVMRNSCPDVGGFNSYSEFFD